MRIISNTTSPYARIARIALAEKGFDLQGTEFVNPWSDAPALLDLNPSARVPTRRCWRGRSTASCRRPAARWA